jgi:putative oxygen-independent coproporphyrinogen III oxidase
MNSPMDFALYIHWPFCASKCPYCDFNSHVRETIDMARWREAYLSELRWWATQTNDRRVTSVFFGGGTPSLMDPSITAALIDEIKKLWPRAEDIEITLEANPSSIEADRFRDFRQAGVNRVSVGVQSLYDDVLKFLGRPHSAAEARAAIAIAASTFERYSFDLIYGRPDQSVDAWKAELAEVLPLTRGHLSAYQLTIEQNTAFATQAARGDFIMPDDETQAAFFEATIDACVAHGLPQYEVSNFAAAGQESQHNLTYWKMRDYIGVGPGAHGRITLDGARQATVGHRAPEIWLERVDAQGHGGHPFVALSDKEMFEETVMMGMRLNDGLEVPDAKMLPKAEKLAGEGYLDRAVLPGLLKPTRKGLLCLNAVTSHLLR